MKTRGRLVLWCVVTASPAIGGTIHVPGDAQTIQIAIDTAQTSDTILVAPGNYNEAINFGGKLITVQSQNPNDPTVVAATIINAGGLGTVVTFAAPGSELNTVLAGFTITGGTIGIQGNGSRAAIRDCVVRNNTSTGISDHNGPITRCTVRNNDGNGLNNCDGTVSQSLIEHNASGLAGCDGLIQDTRVLRNRYDGVVQCNGRILRCTVSGNDRAGINSSNTLLQQSLIDGNGADGLNSSAGRIENSVVAGNGGNGFYGGSISVFNCTVTSNAGYGFNSHNGAIKHAIIWDNVAGPLSGSTTPVQSGTSNPYFVQPGYRNPNTQAWVEGDYHLVAGSPYIDAGSPLFGNDPNDPTVDLDGNPRVVGARVDIGAYEFRADCDGPDFDDDDIADVCDSDMDNDGVPNIVDVCDNTPPGVGVDDNGRPYADMNRDCKVDLYDFAVFQNQLFGP